MAVTNTQTEQQGGGVNKCAPALSAACSLAADPILCPLLQRWLIGQKDQPPPKVPPLPTAACELGHSASLCPDTCADGALLKKVVPVCIWVDNIHSLGCLLYVLPTVYHKAVFCKDIEVTAKVVLVLKPMQKGPLCALLYRKKLLALNLLWHTF